MFTILKSHLLKIAPQAHQEFLEAIASAMTTTFPDFDITTGLRVSHFIGQGAEETAGFKTLTEYADGTEYEGRHDLGNTQPGDGSKFKGRGIFQITGRYNYEKFGKILGIDLIGTPEWGADPKVAVRTACEFWNDRGLNAYADRDDLNGITRRINGGTNGLADRAIFTKRAKNIFLNMVA